MEKIKIYIKSILLPVILGAIVGIFISEDVEMYKMLEKPPLSPPAILFPIVWTILYTLMGISHGILNSKNLSTKETDFIYYAQLIVNLLWPIIFFTLNWQLFAFFWIVFLDILIIIMISTFYAKDKTAGLLQIPYLIWTLFATYLNLSIYILN